MKNRILLKNEDETKLFGEKIGSAITQKLLICLNGDLGAGKTCITKGIAKGLGIMDDITSPTFILVEEYEGRLPLYHFDVYRIDDTEELYFIGFDDYLSKNAVVIIEWSDKIESILIFPDKSLFRILQSCVQKITLLFLPTEAISSDNRRVDRIVHFV